MFEFHGYGTDTNEWQDHSYRFHSGTGRNDRYIPFQLSNRGANHSCEFHSGTGRNGRNASYRPLNRYRRASIPYRVKYRSTTVNTGQIPVNTGQYRSNTGQYRPWLHVLYFSMYELWSLNFEIRSYELVE
jgi:hypothetical protein